MVKYTIKKLPKFNLFKGHQSVVQITFETGKYTRDQIYKIVSDYNNTAYKSGLRGKIMTSIKYPDKHRASSPTNIGDPIKLFSFSDYESTGDKRTDPEYYEKFYVTVSKKIE